MTGMCDCDAELEPGEAEQLVALFAFGLALVDLIVHPKGASELMEAVSGG